MSDDNKLVILILIIVSLLLTSYSCVYREPTDQITKGAIDICGCDRICILRMCNIKGSTSINESEYKKHCN